MDGKLNVLMSGLTLNDKKADSVSSNDNKAGPQPVVEVEVEESSDEEESSDQDPGFHSPCSFTLCLLKI